MNTYSIGTAITLSVLFGSPAPTPLDESAVTPADPTGVVVIVLDPQGNVTTHQPARAGTGSYSIAVTPTVGGVWRYRFEGTGAVVAAADGSFNVLFSELAGVA